MSFLRLLIPYTKYFDHVNDIFSICFRYIQYQIFEETFPDGFLLSKLKILSQILKGMTSSYNCNIISYLWICLLIYLLFCSYCLFVLFVRFVCLFVFVFVCLFVGRLVDWLVCCFVHSFVLPISNCYEQCFSQLPVRR